MRRLALVFAGGFCGTLARFALSSALTAVDRPLPAARDGFPYDILIINLAGAMALGLLYGLAERGANISPDVRVTAGTGFLGAYTTFSSLAYGGATLALGGSRSAAIIYWGGSVALGVGCAALGYAPAGAVWERRRAIRAIARAYAPAPAGLRRPTGATFAVARTLPGSAEDRPMRLQSQEEATVGLRGGLMADDREPAPRASERAS